MDDLPPELATRRAAILTHVIKRGRALRRRRQAALATVIALSVVVPVTAVALATGHNNLARRVATLGSPTTEPATDTSHTPIAAITEESSTTPTTVQTPPTNPTSTQAPETTTTVLVCRNSTDPACGPLYYDPPLTNAPATLQVVKVEPRSPTSGEIVTFTVHASDPDSFLIAGTDFCGQMVFGDGTQNGCGVGCARPAPQYGPWNPPAPRPGDATYTIQHSYTHAGTYKADFSITADACGPRPSNASTSVTVHIIPTTPQT